MIVVGQKYTQHTFSSMWDVCNKEYIFIHIYVTLNTICMHANWKWGSKSMNGLPAREDLFRVTSMQAQRLNFMIWYDNKPTILHWAPCFTHNFQVSYRHIWWEHLNLLNDHRVHMLHSISWVSIHCFYHLPIIWMEINFQLIQI